MTQSIIDIYKDILSERRYKFPAGTWDQNDSKEEFKKCLRYLVFEHLQYTRDDVKDNASIKFITHYKLYGGMRALFSNKVYNAIQYCLPEYEIKPWELGSVPHGYWNDDTIHDMIRFIFNDILKWSREDIVSKFNTNCLIDLGVWPHINRVLKWNNKKNNTDQSLFLMLVRAFPEYQFKRIEFTDASFQYIDTETREAYRYVIYHEFKLTTSDMIKHHLFNTMILNHPILGKSFDTKFRGNLTKLLQFVYPDENWDCIQTRNHIYSRKAQ